MSMAKRIGRYGMDWRRLRWLMKDGQEFALHNGSGPLLRSMLRTLEQPGSTSKEIGERCILAFAASPSAAAQLEWFAQQKETE